ncbi:MAG: diguanylate cyclase [Spirochaeta sp.]|nr:diguanylate cyclase [Spirochaeta sp.]
MTKRGFRTLIIAAALIVATGTTAGVFVQRYLDQRVRARQMELVQTSAAKVRAHIEHVLSQDLLVIHSTAAYIAVHPEITQAEFAAFGAELMNGSATLGNLVAAPDLVISFVYPVAGNEGIIGVDYRDLPDQLPLVLEARTSDSLVVAGPLEILQGGMAIIGRAPVFVPTEDDREFWGIVSALINLDALAREVETLAAEQGIHVALRRSYSAQNFDPAFYGDNDLFFGKQTVLSAVTLPNGSWQIAAEPTGGWTPRGPESTAITVITIALIAIALGLAVSKIRSDELLKQREEELTESKARLDLFFSQSLDGFFFMMLDEPLAWHDATDKDATLERALTHYRLTKINQAMLDQYGATEEMLLGLTAWDFFEHDREAGKASFRELFDTGHLHVDTNERRLDGTPMVVEGDYILLTDRAGRITGHFGIQRDVTSAREAEAKLARYVTLVNTNVIISQTDPYGVITYASDAFAHVCGYSKAELVGKSHNIVRHPDSPPELFKELWDTILSGKEWHGEVKNRKKNGEYYWVSTDITPLMDKAGTITGYMAVRHDITAQKELEIISVTDRLTGLYNRQKTDAVLQEEWERYHRYGEAYALIIFDIDHFKRINDTIGHLAGDSVLKAISHIVTNQIRQTDVAGRWGGEEFLIVCPHTNVDGAYSRAESLRATIEAYDFGIDLPVTASFGVVCVGDVTLDPDAGGPPPTEIVLNAADTAMYAAKEGGRNRVRRAGPAEPA